MRTEPVVPRWLLEAPDHLRTRYVTAATEYDTIMQAFEKGGKPSSFAKERRSALLREMTNIRLLLREPKP
jgi:hypothetical protein